MGFIFSSVFLMRPQLSPIQHRDADQTFVNCGSNPHSYLAFYFNPRNPPPSRLKAVVIPRWRNGWRWWFPRIRAINFRSLTFCNLKKQFVGCGYSISGHKTLGNIGGVTLVMHLSTFLLYFRTFNVCLGFFVSLENFSLITREGLHIFTFFSALTAS